MLQVNFRNMIGISIIDCQPIEILEISFKNLKLNYVVTEEQIMNLNRIINQDLEQTSSLQVTNPTVLKQQEETYITNTNTLIQISLDSFYINNQLIDTQFPGKRLPFLLPLSLRSSPLPQYRHRDRSQNPRLTLGASGGSGGPNSNLLNNDCATGG